MMDLYFSASSKIELDSMFDHYTARIGPMQGKAATQAYVDSFGNTVEALPAKGDPALWYLALRVETAVVPPINVSVCDAATGRDVLGVWA